MKLRSSIVWLAVLVVVYVSGSVYGLVRYGTPALGGFYSLSVCLPLIAFERGLFLRGLRRWLHDLPTWAYLIGQLTFYYVMITAGIAFAGSLLWLMRGTEMPWVQAAFPPLTDLAYSLSVTLVMTATLRVRDLLGKKVFLNLLVGRYRRPISEERVFLLVDLEGSTALAEEFGDLRAMEFLSALFSTMAEPVARQRGSIDDYIGDAAIISWPMKTGLENARCVRCLFGILKAVDEKKVHWLETYGRVPVLRAALHGGPVVTAEIGRDHHKIAYFGDTINTTARIENISRLLGRQFLMSKHLRDRIDLPASVTVEELGSHPVRGRDQHIDLVSLSCANTRQKRESPALEAQ
ncbi:adenylate/guanylate cyclase domain-containing protein [Sinorhizobium sp. BG8]|uniref:adenylate/guanylate cyclase domain-containing protein n=1 Tax=Sinorhizobium sp. BG8 TaxID=2613773 RepID=UPI00193DE5D2|nr:adenylate/guanylate cyclase domain-containing protein [Sinorhizobium sp. BG8]QRM57487.1 adenylate/guanylate cyclase domain-containing protein [Sinorhizobium sp. BG8]